MRKTQSIEYGKFGGASIVDVDVPAPSAGEVQIRTLACGICQWDINTWRNGTDAPYAAPPGHEGVANVAETGPGVTGFEIGERVMGRGFAGYYNVPAGSLIRLPVDSELADEYWLVEPVACVVNGLDHCEAKPGDRVAVIGCGFMGQMFVQGLSHSPVDELVAFDIIEDRLTLALQHGATQVCNLKTTDFDSCVRRFQDMKIDTVVDCTGAQAGLDLSCKLVRRGGRILLFGWNHGARTIQGDEWHVRGFTVVNAAPASGKRDVTPAAIRLIHRGIIALKPLVTHVGALTDLPRLLETGAIKDPAYIKGVVKYGESD
jgi:threonine dehydrogenase-like Zn-dependent dehydrogenase